MIGTAKGISIFNPAAGVEAADFSVSTRSDIEALARAEGALLEAERLLAGVNSILAGQALRGRAFKLAELLHSRRLLAGYIYAIQITSEEVARAGGAA